MNITDIFGANLRRIRLQKELSQEELADISGLHRTYIGSVERGERNITLINADKLAKSLKVKISILFEENK